MNQKFAFSLLQPAGENVEYRILSDNVLHDLPDKVCRKSRVQNISM